jgi:DNA-binding NtrC family response regulator
LEEARLLGSTSQISRDILWVDDEPANNALEIARLTNEGINITQMRSTASAIRYLKKVDRRIALVVSDMGRQEGRQYNNRAGLDLVQQIREFDPDIPVLIYTDPGSAPGLKEKVYKSGGQGITGSSLELSEMIHRVLSQTV